jgi:hypothetical protein
MNKASLAHDVPAVDGPRTLGQLRALLALMTAGELCEDDSEIVTPGESLLGVFSQLHRLGFSFGCGTASMRRCVSIQYRQAEGGSGARFYVLTPMGRSVLLEAIANRPEPLPFNCPACITFGDAVHQFDQVLGTRAAIYVRGLRALRSELATQHRSKQ